jgi:hypothetical protein
MSASKTEDVIGEKVQVLIHEGEPADKLTFPKGTIIRRSNGPSGAGYIIELDNAILSKFAGIQNGFKIKHLLLIPIGTEIEWLITKKEQAGLPILIQIHIVKNSQLISKESYTKQDTFYLTRGEVKLAERN